MPPQKEAPHLIHPKYRPDIDGLRAVAVVSVVGYHAFPDLVRGGFIGVDIFFVISGFLISTIIFGSLAGAGFSYREFYARRIRRIFPALLPVMAATFAFGWYVLLSDEFRQLGKHLLGSAGFVSNLVLWGEAGYFDTAAEVKPLQHLWSLAVEEQFYIFWPLLLGLVWRIKGPRGLMFWMTVAAGLSFLLNVGGVHRHADATFYSPLSRIWELAAGAMLALAAMRRTTEGRAVRGAQVRSVAGLVLLGLGLSLIQKDKAFPGWWAIL
ncbi:MAG: acyltransferase, partial [Variovorax sp.]